MISANEDGEWWEEAVGEDLEQGHLLAGLLHPLLSLKTYNQLKEPNNQAGVKFAKINGITLTQSCDFRNEKVKRSVICRVISIEEARTDRKFSDRRMEGIRRCHSPEWLMLAGATDPRDKDDALLVDFTSTISLPLDYLKHIAKELGSHPALRSPYVEYLSSGFARYFSRVAFPLDLPTFFEEPEEPEERLDASRVVA
jgi:hypothetical protein